ncbi:MAG: cytochrome c maturation protein CcmE [Anaerolineae bacterium]
MAESSTILRGAVSSSKANSKVKFFVGGLVIVALIAYLIISSISTAGAYFREVSEVLDQQTALIGKNLRVSGRVVTESIQYDATNLDLRFRISDPADPTKQLPIQFHGVQPDQIGRENTEAIVEGTLLADGSVQANNLMLKCPSRYEEGVPKDYEEIKVEAVR